MRTLVFAFVLLLQSNLLLAEYFFYDDTIRKTYSISKKFQLDDFKLNRRQDNNTQLAVVVGAGPAGLMGALVLKQEGFDVIVLEKRSGDFNRLNRVNLKAESESELARLGLLEEFRTKIGTPLKRHDYYRLFEFQEEAFHEELVESLIGRFEKPLTFEPEDADQRFNEDGLYTITIAEFEQFLANAAIERGVSIVTDLLEVQVTDQTASQSKGITARHKNGKQKELLPDLIVLADGANGNTRKGGYRNFSHPGAPHPCHGEKWVFGNVSYLGQLEAFVTVMLDYSNEKFIKMANVIFEPRHQELNIAVSVENEDLSPSAIREMIKSTANRAFAIHGIQEPARVRFTSNVVSITNKAVDQHSIGDNVILVGDRAGVSSPLAGLGATLATTSYPYGIRIVAQALKTGDKNAISQALSFYNHQSNTYVYKWLKTSARVKSFITQMPFNFLLSLPEALTPLSRRIRYHYSEF